MFIKKILNLLSKRELHSETVVKPSIKEEPLYDEEFELALGFSSTLNFAADSRISSFEENRVNELAEELANITSEFLNQYPSMGFKDVITRFGGDCATVHFSILQFIKQYYSDLPVNITLGEVSYNSGTYFNFNEDKCKDWMTNGSPRVFDCHAWITIGRDIIIDVTIGTYVNTRIDSDKSNNVAEDIFGGIVFGRHDNFKCIPISGVSGKIPEKLNSLKYSPVVIGAESINRLAPKQP